MSKGSSRSRSGRRNLPTSLLQTEAGAFLWIFQLLLLFLLFHGLLGSQEPELQLAEIGKNFTIDWLSHSNNVTWKFNGTRLEPTHRFMIRVTDDALDSNDITSDSRQYKNSLFIENVRLTDSGIYTVETENNGSASFLLKTFLPTKVVDSNNRIVKQKNGGPVTLYCLFEAFPHNATFTQGLKWLKENTTLEFLDKSTNRQQVNQTYFNLTLELAEVYKSENGSYACVSYSLDGEENARADIVLLVMDVPQVSIDFVKAVGARQIYLNWTVNDGNDPVQKYFIQYLQENKSTYDYYDHIIGGKNTSYVLNDFKPNTSYHLKISGKNGVGDGTPRQYHTKVQTLAVDPVFIPKIESTGSTSSTITIGWNPPPPELLDYVQYYELVVSEAGDNPKTIEEVFYQQNSRNLPYMFDNLHTATNYEFRVRACSDLTKLCGPWSEVVNGTTMDGIASEPTNLNVTCVHDPTTRVNSVNVTWNAPNVPNGKIVSYHINLTGQSTYKRDGKLHTDTWIGQTRRLEEHHHRTVYESVNPNTNYTVKVMAITRHKKHGAQAIGKCSMPITVPDSVPRASWSKVKVSDNKCVFKLSMPKVSERNGPICCYRLFLLRIQNADMDPPPPESLRITSYQEVHAANNTVGGAYLAEMFSATDFKSEIFLGDGLRFFESMGFTNSYEADKECRKCMQGLNLNRNVYRVNADAAVRPENARNYLFQKEQVNAANLTENAAKILDNRRRRKRYPKVISGENFQSIVESRELVLPTDAMPKTSNDLNSSWESIYDGELDMNSNYTGYLEVIVREGDTVLTAHSNYFDVITPRTVAEQFHDSEEPILPNFIIEIIAILVVVVLILLIVLCFLHHYSTKQAGSGEEVISLRDSLSRVLFGGRTTSHRHFISPSNAKSSDFGPISKADLHIAYKNRHKDTDYGFLHEYEMLPNRFSDRTTKHSDMKENSTKNRYPDIKAYDQTRVKLSQVNGMMGSDYINANFVIGYKERKKFICAQGPMEATVNDFWRMIWEQHLEIIVMLTNLEEYNKTKCAKYWPEKVQDCKQYGDITVKFISENKFGDYLIRNLDICKRNFLSENEEEFRQITQYHYLVWKDFMAPEHPHGIIKFIRNINSAYSVQRGPILVHCSAGVGRTGTLVALDSLIQQLEEENQVAIFNTVCDMRHQRNFLVQSLKQYIFLYRALLDTAQFGNTEISVGCLSSKIEALKSKADGKEKCNLEIEFEKLTTAIDETNKACSVGGNEENALKNRSDSVIPYDRNRVILTPVPMKENSTYINASFIEGYDNSEAFIIMQDPMENTIGDFWRMLSEQSVTTLVMISEVGEGLRKCPRYWADDEIQYDHILVKYIQSESCPYYTRREFHVTNCKIHDTITVTQFQYNGWPTVEGEVPEVCRGIIELVNQAQTHHNKERNNDCRSPIAVHCSLGTDRSSIFVAMCILVQQLRTEKCVDICSTARKLRSQRPGLLNTYAQYEFLHRAIANYADLYKVSIETSSS